jgi:hypothetical protein
MGSHSAPDCPCSLLLLLHVEGIKAGHTILEWHHTSVRRILYREKEITTMTLLPIYKYKMFEGKKERKIRKSVREKSAEPCPDLAGAQCSAHHGD